jgi:hypothetical protein
MAIWYIFPVLVHMLFQEKSGNPASAHALKNYSFKLPRTTLYVKCAWPGFVWIRIKVWYLKFDM